MVQLLVPSCCDGPLVSRRKPHHLLVVCVPLATATVMLMGGGFAFSAATVAHAAPRFCSQSPADVGLFTGPATVSATPRLKPAMAALGLTQSMPQICDDDFDCNGGKANFPFRCLDMLLTKICVNPDDFEKNTPTSAEPAYVPIPVEADGNGGLQHSGLAQIH